jgi:hypothetical protein
MSDLNDHNGNAWGLRAKWAFAVFAIIGAFFLLAEHRAHVFPYLPWLILLACPLMHFFMHGGHGGHGGDHDDGNRPRGGNGGSSDAKLEGSRDSDPGAKGESHSHHGGRP